MRRDIQVAHGQENEVGKALKVAKARRPVFDDLDDPVQAFCYRIGQVAVDERGDVLEVFAHRVGKGFERGDTAAQNRGDPAFDEFSAQRLFL